MSTPPVALAHEGSEPASKPASAGIPSCRRSDDLALGCPRFFFAGSTHVYAVLSSRARGLSVGVNLNPDQHCNFDCCYCEVDRSATPRGHGHGPVPIKAQAVSSELAGALDMVNAGLLLKHPYFSAIPAETLRLAHVAISGDGEPTLCPNFAEAVEGIVHLRAAGLAPYFKLVLVTNATALDRPGVRAGLRLFTRADEIWAKLDAGTQEFMERVNRPQHIAIEKVLGNILELGRQRPVVIQSMFVEIDGELSERSELEAYARRLTELKEGGAQISLVQIYSATRPHHSRRVRHLSLRVLSEVASFVHQHTGLRVEVF